VLVQEYAASPAAKLARELAESPAAKLARELSQSPAAALLRDLESPAAKLARGIGLPSSAEQTSMASTAKMLAGITIDPGVANMLGGAKPLQIDPSVADAFAKIKPIAIALEFAKTISEAHKVFSDFENAHGCLANAVTTIVEQNRSLEQSLLSSLGGTIGDVARMNQWAST
jgi:hypothetical protein